MNGRTEPNERVTALGLQLVEVHEWLLEQVAALRDRGPANAKPLGDLRAHCLTFCSVLSQHHTDEDDGVFPALAREFPELRPALDQLRRDHDIVAGMLSRVVELVEGSGAQPEPADAERVRAELDGLAALMESHFGYEEKKLFSILNAMPAGRLKDLDTVLPPN